METVVKVGRSVGGGVYRATGVVLRGARRFLAAIPLLGINADDPADESIDKSIITGGEDENAAASPVEEKSLASPNESASADNEANKEEAAPAAETAEVESSTAEEKQEAPSSPTAPIPVPVEDTKEEKIDTEIEKVEVSPTQAVAAPIEVISQPPKPIITPSIIERKTSEDFPSLFPSSPPPTPINPSPLQQAQQAAANASALAEALKLPAEDLANACHLDYDRNECEIVNNQQHESHDTTADDAGDQEVKIETQAISQAVNVNVESQSIEPVHQQKTDNIEAVVTQVIVQSIVENIPQMDINISQEHSVQQDLSDNLKTSTIDKNDIIAVKDEKEEENIMEIEKVEEKVVVATAVVEEEEMAVDKIASNQQQITSETLDKIHDENSKTEDNTTSEDLAHGNNNDNDNNTDDKSKSCSNSQLNNINIDTTQKINSADIEEMPPPLPKSPIPVPKASAEFMNFITSQIEDAPHYSEQSSLESCDISPVAAETVTQLKSDIEDSSLQSLDSSILPSPPTEVMLDTSIESQNPSSQQDLNNDLPPPPPPPELAAYDEPELASSNPDMIVDNVPPRSPSPDVSHNTTTIESSIKSVELEINDDDNKNDINVDNQQSNHNNHILIDNEETIGTTPIINKGLNSHVDFPVPIEESDMEIRKTNTVKEITTTTHVDNALLHPIQMNDQSIAETEAPVEITNSTTESTESPAVPTEISAPVAPAITEDVTSVTKAVEEIDINEKAVAAAVNENIESANKNEIIADMNYQNNLNE